MHRFFVKFILLIIFTAPSMSAERYELEDVSPSYNSSTKLNMGTREKQESELLLTAIGEREESGETTPLTDVNTKENYSCLHLCGWYTKEFALCSFFNIFCCPLCVIPCYCCCACLYVGQECDDCCRGVKVKRNAVECLAILAVPYEVERSFFSEERRKRQMESGDCCC